MHGAIPFPNHIYHNCNANWNLHVINLVKCKYQCEQVAPNTIPQNIVNISNLCKWPRTLGSNVTHMKQVLGYLMIGCISISRMTSNIKSTFSLGHASTMIVNDVRGNTINQSKRRKGYEINGCLHIFHFRLFTYCSI